MSQPKVECVSSDCYEMIYISFWIHHGGYCTKHPEKWPKIRDGWRLGENIENTYKYIQKKNTKASRIE